MSCYKVSNEYGNIFIDSDAIAATAGLATMECYGVIGMASVSPASGIIKLLKREHFTKGINIKMENNQVIIDLHVIISYGIKIPVVAKNIISGVTYAVENSTGIKVKKVNLNIEGIKIKE